MLTIFNSLVSYGAEVTKSAASFASVASKSLYSGLARAQATAASASAVASKSVVSELSRQGAAPSQISKAAEKAGLSAQASASSALNVVQKSVDSFTASASVRPSFLPLHHTLLTLPARQSAAARATETPNAFFADPIGVVEEKIGEVYDALKSVAGIVPRSAGSVVVRRLVHRSDSKLIPFVRREKPLNPLRPSPLELPRPPRESSTMLSPLRRASRR